MDAQDLRLESFTQGWAVPLSIHQFPGCSALVARCWWDLTDEHTDNVFGVKRLRYLLEASASDIFSSGGAHPHPHDHIECCLCRTESGNTAPQSLALIRSHVCCDNRLGQVTDTDPVMAPWEETLSHLCVTALFINHWQIIGWCRARMITLDPCEGSRGGTPDLARVPDVAYLERSCLCLSFSGGLLAEPGSGPGQWRRPFKVPDTTSAVCQNPLPDDWSGDGNVECGKEDLRA